MSRDVVHTAVSYYSGWTSLIGAPPYPDHPSGLSALGCSVADTMQHFYGRDQATFGGTTPAA
jgi:hypothetical protein